MPPARAARPLVALLLALVLSACGGTSSPDEAQAPEAGAGPSTRPERAEPTCTEVPPGEPGSAEGRLPSVAVVDLTACEVVDLAALDPGDRPLLVWAWAPSCPSCQAESADVVAWAAENGDRVAVVALGTQDGVAPASGFRNTLLADATFPVVWEDGFRSWQDLGITGQPTLVLLDESGAEVGRWFGLDAGGLDAAVASMV